MRARKIKVVKECRVSSPPKSQTHNKGRFLFNVKRWPSKKTPFNLRLAPQLMVLLCALAVANPSFSKPTGVKESEFLFSCRPSCERDAAHLGLSPLTAKSRCNCYCRTVFREMSDADINYYMQYRDYSQNIRGIAAAAIQTCILKD